MTMSMSLEAAGECKGEGEGKREREREREREHSGIIGARLGFYSNCCHHFHPNQYASIM